MVESAHSLKQPLISINATACLPGVWKIRADLGSCFLKNVKMPSVTSEDTAVHCQDSTLLKWLPRSPESAQGQCSAYEFPDRCLGQAE
jgi:hypothetical protein